MSKFLKGIRVVRGWAHQIPFEDASFDVITLTGVYDTSTAMEGSKPRRNETRSETWRDLGRRDAQHVLSDRNPHALPLQPIPSKTTR